MSASINVLQKVPGCKSAMTWTGETQAVHASSISFMSRGRIENAWEAEMARGRQM